MACVLTHLFSSLSSLLEKTKKLVGVKVAENEENKETPQHTPNFDNKDLQETVFDIIKTIKDPEKPFSLEELHVVQEEDIHISDLIGSDTKIVKVIFTPTVPHCSLATLIGLCIRVKLQRSLPQKIKLDIMVKKGYHITEDEINKQVNDKERVAAAIENPSLRSIVDKCIEEEYQ